ncbi:MAG TPA: aminotransferase class III-fold pyridoxal phosphate-dependent enzyme [Anaeromyxobacteraceae bacterium]|nr:aminotransferase class III-fold pyridoxal phosphate-dependent enzyme [Anaeromyxobacteraceae bacterium]
MSGQLSFERILGGGALAETPVRGLAELLLGSRPGERDGAPIILGCWGRGSLDVSLGQLRAAATAIAGELAERGLGPGDTVCLARLPRTSEAACAVAYVALSTAGLRVLLPMYLEVERFGDWLRRSGARAVLWSAAEVEEGESEADSELLETLRSRARGLGVRELCLVRDLHLPHLVRSAAALAPDDARARALLSRPSLDDECLLLTTSGTSGLAKLVRYRQRALLRSCAAWEAAGLFRPERLGGRGLALLFAHSMGVRALWNALWTRQPICLVTPEWFLERPELARAQLMRMRPEHVTGGPATFRTLLELARVFPELKDTCLRDLRCAVSTGAAYDPDLARRVRTALGLELENALGMTETMQVTSTLLGGARGGAMGAPLPGVRLGLLREPDLPGQAFRLHVSTPFGCSGYVGDAEGPVPPEGAWLDTGDVVALEGQDLVHLGRRERDFVKDGFGAKVPLARVAGWYAGLGEPVEHLVFSPLRDEPGLAAVLFLRAGACAGQPRVPVAQAAVLDRVRSLLEARHERLLHELDEMERRHFTVSRFACVLGDPPRTPKGTIDSAAVRAAYGSLLDRLCGALVKAPELVALDRDPFARTSYVRLASPRRGELMRLVGLDRHYLRGRGDRLTWAGAGREVEVVDFVGGFGVNLLGHRHPEVVAAAADFLEGDGVFLADQGSGRLHEGQLARRLAMLVGGITGAHYVVRLASTGAEAVEMALAHAALERQQRWERLRGELLREHGGREPARVRELLEHDEALLGSTRPRVVAIEGGFHGHTLGARALLSSAAKRRPLDPLLRVETIFLPRDGRLDVEAFVRDCAIPLRTLRHQDGVAVEVTVPFTSILAAVAEPIQGEGGVRAVAPDLLRQLSAREFPLVIDEIQSGLGRTGALLASAGVRGDYYLIGKALGGGVAKIAALLVDRSRYVPRFDELHTSTFQGDAFSCAVASRVLEVVARDDVPGRARQRGGALRASLEKVRCAYPDVVREVRGRGLLLGVELDPRVVADRFVLRAFADRELLGVLAAAYLLNVHRVRILPTLSAPLTLRVEPSAYLDDLAIAQLARGLMALCRAVRDNDVAEILSYLVAEEEAAGDGLGLDQGLPARPSRAEPAAPGAARVAFLAHFILPEREMAMMEPSLRRLTVTARRALFHRLAPALDLKPLTVFAQNLFGGRVHFTSLALPADVAMLEELHRRGDRRVAAERIQEAVDLAGRMGCTVMALGAYTSILTRDGTSVLAPPGVRVTSGNSLTVAVGARRLLRACRDAGIDPARAKLAIVGASGNIGRGVAGRLLAAGPFRRALLVGRRADALEAVRHSLERLRADLDIRTAADLPALGDADVIAIATNSNDPIVYRRHLRPGRPVVIVDVSVPSAVADDVRDAPEVTVVPFSGTVAVPGEPGFAISSHTRPGTGFACAAEAMLLGLEPAATAGLRLVGDVDLRAVEILERLADEHGFLAHLGEGGFRSGCQPSPEPGPSRRDA